MSLFQNGMNSEISLCRCLGVSDAGTLRYDKAELIRGRMEATTRAIITKSGETAPATAVLYTRDNVNPKDTVFYQGQAWPIQAVAEKANVFGTFDHWEAVI